MRQDSFSIQLLHRLPIRFRRKRQVHNIVKRTFLVRLAAAWPERYLMRADKQSARFLPKQILGAIVVMHINPPQPRAIEPDLQPIKRRRPPDKPPSTSPPTDAYLHPTRRCHAKGKLRATRQDNAVDAPLRDRPCAKGADKNSTSKRLSSLNTNSNRAIRMAARCFIVEAVRMHDQNSG